MSRSDGNWVGDETGRSTVVRVGRPWTQVSVDTRNRDINTSEVKQVGDVSVDGKEGRSYKLGERRTVLGC